jgi:hypothetical protein
MDSYIYISLLPARLHCAIIFVVTSWKPQKARLLKSRRAGVGTQIDTKQERDDISETN